MDLGEILRKLSEHRMDFSEIPMDFIESENLFNSI